MSTTRRRVLEAVAVTQSALLGGCFGVFGGGGSDSTPTARSAQGTATPTAQPNATQTATPTETPTATTTATPVANADLAAATENILAEFEWFRTERDGVITNLRVRANGVLGAIEEIRATDEPTQEDVATFRDATTAVAEYVQANMVDHFDVAPALRIGDNVYVRDLERAVRRGDVSMRDSVLARAGSFYQRVTSGPYVDNQFSKRPIYGALYDMLIPGGANRIVALANDGDEFITWAHPVLSDTMAADGVAQHTHEFPSGHRVFTHAHDHSQPHPVRDHTNEPDLNELYAYGDDGVALLTDSASWRERLDDYTPAFTGLFGPAKADNRTQGVTLFVGNIDAGFSSSPLYVQGFDSVSAAQQAVASSDQSPVSSSGTTTFAGREWERIFYDLNGTTIYAYRFRAGSTVIMALPSDVPWENRIDWTAGLGSTWIGTQS